jgi:hypothetical protein
MFKKHVFAEKRKIKHKRKIQKVMYLASKVSVMDLEC